MQNFGDTESLRIFISHGITTGGAIFMLHGLLKEQRILGAYLEAQAKLAVATQVSGGVPDLRGVAVNPVAALRGEQP